VIGGIITFVVFFVLSSLVSDAVNDMNFQFQHFGFVFYFVVFGPFTIWSLILSIKALKIANSFGAGKALGLFYLQL